MQHNLCNIIYASIAWHNTHTVSQKNDTEHLSILLHIDCSTIINPRLFRHSVAVLGYTACTTGILGWLSLKHCTKSLLLVSGIANIIWAATTVVFGTNTKSSNCSTPKFGQVVRADCQIWQSCSVSNALRGWVMANQHSDEPTHQLLCDECIPHHDRS